THFDVERASAAADIVTEPTHSARVIYGAVERLDGIGVLGSDIDVAVVCSHRQAGDGHAFDEHVGVAFHDEAVGESARVALVGITGNVLLVGRRVEDGFPFDASRESSAATTSQA